MYQKFSFCFTALQHPDELVSSVLSSHGMHRKTGLMGPNPGSWHWTSRNWCGTSATKAIQELQLGGHQCLWLGPCFCKTCTLWQGGLSPPGPLSLSGAALKYSRLRILCCTDLPVLKSFSFLKALCAQGFASIHPEAPQDAPGEFPLPAANPAIPKSCWWLVLQRN